MVITSHQPCGLELDFAVSRLSQSQILHCILGCVQYILSYPGLGSLLHQFCQRRQENAKCNIHATILGGYPALSARL